MPGSNLTRIEAEERKAVIEAPIHYHVDLDLTVGAKNFGSKSFICFNAKPGSSTFLDLIADEVTSIDLNGKSLDPAVAFQDNRIELIDLKEKNEVTVEARCRYSNTGEGCTARSTRPMATSTCTPSSRCRTLAASTPCSTSLT